MEEDESFVEAAEDDQMAAQMLIRLSRSGTHRQLGQLPSSSRPARPPELPPAWGRRGTRSSRLFTMDRVLTWKKPERRRGSPTTPLSWSGGSATSESVCEDPCSASPSPPEKTGARKQTAANRREIRIEGMQKLDTMDEETTGDDVPLSRALSGANVEIEPMKSQNIQAVADLREKEELRKEIKKQDEINHTMRADNADFRRKFEAPRSAIIPANCADHPPPFLDEPRISAFCDQSASVLRDESKIRSRISLPFDLNLFPDDG